MSFELIETVTVGAGGAASIEFTSIPQDGTDLVIVVSGRSDGGSAGGVSFNDAGFFYGRVDLRGSGSSASTGITAVNGTTVIEIPLTVDSDWTADTFASSKIYVSNYTSSNNKSVSAEFALERDTTFTRMGIVAGSYTTSSGITEVKLKATTSTGFVQYSSASLYKITAA